MRGIKDPLNVHDSTILTSSTQESSEITTRFCIPKSGKRCWDLGFRAEVGEPPRIHVDFYVVKNLNLQEREESRMIVRTLNACMLLLESVSKAFSDSVLAL